MLDNATRAPDEDMMRQTIAAALPGLLTAAAILFSAPFALASGNDCGTLAAAIVDKAYPAAEERAVGTFVLAGATITTPESGEDGPHTMICRIWPAYPRLMLVAVPLMKVPETSEVDPGNSGNSGDLELLVLDAETLDIEQRLLLADRMSDDAISIRTIAFDTARYQMTKGQTAFGLRITKASSSVPNPSQEVDLWLYAIRDRQLVTVLDGLVVSDNSGEWNTRCAGLFDETARTLAMDKSSHGGQADIVITETTSSRTTDVDDKGECVETENGGKTSRYRLVYDRQRYDVPEALRIP